MKDDIIYTLAYEFRKQMDEAYTRGEFSDIEPFKRMTLVTVVEIPVTCGIPF